jgi:hypothetical protein
VGAAGAYIVVVGKPVVGAAGAYIVVVEGTAGAYVVAPEGAAGAYIVVVGGAAGAVVVAVPAPGRLQFVQVEAGAYAAVFGVGRLPKCSDSHDAWLTAAVAWIATTVATPIVEISFHRYLIVQLPSSRR